MGDKIIWLGLPICWLVLTWDRPSGGRQSRPWWGRGSGPPNTTLWNICFCYLFVLFGFHLFASFLLTITPLSETFPLSLSWFSFSFSDSDYHRCHRALLAQISDADSRLALEYMCCWVTIYVPNRVFAVFIPVFGFCYIFCFFFPYQFTLIVSETKIQHLISQVAVIFSETHQHGQYPQDLNLFGGFLIFHCKYWVCPWKSGQWPLRLAI